MKKAKEIADSILDLKNSFERYPDEVESLASAYLELKKRIVLLLRENTLLILDSIEPRTDKDVTIVGLKKEITKLKEENEKQREINLDLWNEIEQLKTVTINDLTGSLSKANIKNDKLSEKLESTNAEKEKLKKSREVLRKAVEFYGDISNWKDVSSRSESSFKYFYCLRQRTKDFEAFNEKYHFYAGKKAREAMQADNEIFADDIK